MIELRPYQARAIEAVRDKLRGGARRIVLVLPTGAGKTITASSIIQSSVARGWQCGWVVHRVELIKQAVLSLQQAGVSVGIIAPWADPSPAPVQVCSVQTLLARNQLPPFDLLVWDECHHSAAPSYSQIAQAYQSAICLGLTATPERYDGIALGNLWDALVVGASYSELLAGGYIVPARVYAPEQNNSTLAMSVPDALRTWCAGRKTVIFSSSVDAAHEQARECTATGVPTACIEGRTDAEERARLLEQFRAGELRAITNVQILTEGFDCPDMGAVIIARGFSYASSYLQAVGRALRPAPGKTEAIVVDLKGSANDHGLPHEDREYSLEGKAIKGHGEQYPVRQCPACMVVSRAPEFRDSTCPVCGARIPGRPDPAVRAAAIQEITAKHTDTRRVETLASLVRTGNSKGYKRGWAMYQYKIRYGAWPPRDILIGALIRAQSPGE